MTQRGSRSTQKQMPPRCWREVLDRQPQPPRAGRAEHQPVRALRKILVGQRVAEDLVVDPEVLARRRASSGCRSCRRSRTRRPACRRSPSAPSAAPDRRAATRPRTAPKRFRSAKPLISRARIPAELRRVVEPERRAGRRIEMPGDDLAHPRVQRVARSVHPCRKLRRRYDRARLNLHDS